MKQLFWCNMAHLHYLLDEYSTITSITTGVDYNNDDDHEDDDAMPSLLFFHPQEFVRSPSNAIAIFGSNDKEKTGYG